IKALEEDGEIIKTIPDSQDIDEGNFDLTFSVLVISKEDQEIIKNKINKIAELTLAKIQKVDYKTLNTPKTDNVSADASPDHDKPLITKDNSNLNKEARKQGKAKQTVRVDIERLDSLMNLVGELVMHKGRIEQIGATLKLPEFNETLEQINRVSSDLQSVVMKVRMVAVETVFNRFPRMVRDLAKELEKDIDFIIEGQDTELDRTVIDELGDPLLHLLRNSLDHGIEPAEVRAAAGKPTKGTVILRARHEGNNVYIEVEDDGGGIIKEGILTKAVEKGLVTSEIANEMSFEETAALLFTSGFSTAKELTDISGRGVGLDVVKTKIESLSGEIFIESKPGIGTKFKIKLPLTLAIIQALMISVGDEYYAIPLSSVDETTIINVNDIKNVHSQEVIMLRGVVLPIYRLADLVSISSDIPEENAFMHVVIVHRGGKQIGLAVDTLIGQQEIVIKSLGKLFQGLPGIAGGFVGRDGRVRLILDVVTLF
ncbi:MAG: chemotaxis protein CheA, partial [Syntrophomonadaceae bacterium]|nr:chemotaxis protein CheA [Syntrophomonadaceae bacterium]